MISSMHGCGLTWRNLQVCFSIRGSGEEAVGVGRICAEKQQKAISVCIAAQLQQM